MERIFFVNNKLSVMSIHLSSRHDSTGSPASA